MTRNPHFQAIFTAIAAAWVGGWGFVMFRYPELFAGLNSRFMMKWLSGPKFISFTKKLGVVEMVLASLSVVFYLIEAAFGFVSF